MVTKIAKVKQTTIDKNNKDKYLKKQLQAIPLYKEVSLSVQVSLINEPNEFSILVNLYTGPGLET